MRIVRQQIASMPRKTRGQGRPRSEASRSAVLSTVLELLARKSLREITVEEIAKEAGVAKTTVYRWWENKAQLAIDAFLNDISVKAPFVEKETILDTIKSQVRALAFQYKGRDGEIIRQIIAECQANPTDLEMFRKRFLYVRRAAAKVTIQRARAEGVIRSSISDEELIDLIYGPLYYRLMLQHAKIDEEFVNSLLNYVFKALELDLSQRPPRVTAPADAAQHA